MRRQETGRSRDRRRGRLRATCGPQCRGSCRPSSYGGFAVSVAVPEGSKGPGEGGLRGEENVGPDAAGAHLLREGRVVDAGITVSIVGLIKAVRPLLYSPGVLAGRTDVATEVGPRVAPEAVLPLHICGPFRFHGVTHQHAEALRKFVSIVP